MTAIWQPKLATAKKINATKTLSVSPKLIVNAILNNVKKVKKNRCLCVISDTAPRNGAKLATKTIEKPKEMP